MKKSFILLVIGIRIGIVLRVYRTKIRTFVQIQEFMIYIIYIRKVNFFLSRNFMRKLLFALQFTPVGCDQGHVHFHFSICISCYYKNLYSKSTSIEIS